MNRSDVAFALPLLACIGTIPLAAALPGDMDTAPPTTISYTYDAIGRLIAVSYTGQSLNYRYDPAGNILSVDAGDEPISDPLEDIVQITATSPAVMGAGAGDDTYILDAARLTGRERITISDSQGNNILQLVEGLSIRQSLVAPTALRLILSNGAQVTVLGADAFTYDAGGNALAGITHYPVSFGVFAQGALGVTVPPSGTVTGGPVVISALPVGTAVPASSTPVKVLAKASPPPDAVPAPLGGGEVSDLSGVALPPVLSELLEGATVSVDDFRAIPDGTRVLFGTPAALVAEDTNGVTDLYLYETERDLLERVSLGTTGAQGNAASTDGRLDGLGQRVAFVSAASNLVAGDTNGVSDIFVRDLRLNTTERVSVGFNGEQADGMSAQVQLDASGEWVAFVSEASNLVGDDTNGVADVFLRDLTHGVTERVSLEPSGFESSSAANAPTMDGTATLVVYERSDPKGCAQLDAFDARIGRSDPVVLPTLALDEAWCLSRPAISADRRYLAAVLRRGRSEIPEIWIVQRETGDWTTLAWPSDADAETSILELTDEGRAILLRQDAHRVSTPGVILDGWLIVPNPLAP